MKAILTIGVSASGKSTWATNYVKEKSENKENWTVVNQDEIRLELIRQIKGSDIDEVKELKLWDYNPANDSEKSVKAYWDILVKNAISQKVDGIIISDTNLDGGIKKIEKLISFGLIEKNINTKLFSISFEEAVERDKNRKFTVGEDVLKMQFDKLNLLLSNTKT